MVCYVYVFIIYTVTNAYYSLAVTPIQLVVLVSLICVYCKWTHSSYSAFFFQLRLGGMSIMHKRALTRKAEPERVANRCTIYEGTVARLCTAAGERMVSHGKWELELLKFSKWCQTHICQHNRIYTCPREEGRWNWVLLVDTDKKRLWRTNRKVSGKIPIHWESSFSIYLDICLPSHFICHTEQNAGQKRTKQAFKRNSDFARDTLVPCSTRSVFMFVLSFHCCGNFYYMWNEKYVSLQNNCIL